MLQEIKRRILFLFLALNQLQIGISFYTLSLSSFTSWTNIENECVGVHVCMAYIPWPFVVFVHFSSSS
jgi:hypothetical protein